jgi:hypothetical protein
MLAALAAVTLTVPACSPGPTPAPVPGSTGPSAQRPVLNLAFTVARDLHTATGREQVDFTPTARICELVFRDWPNKPTTAQTGSSLTITHVAVEGRTIAPKISAAGAPAGAPGTLVEVPLPSCVDAGHQIHADLGFRLTLGADADERVGYSPSRHIAWFGTAFPLLSWVRGQGWTRDPAVSIPGETVTSEEFRLAALTVTAANGYSVVGTGASAGTGRGTEPNTTTHRFTADTVRDVAVSVGRFTMLTRQLGDLRLHLATPATGVTVDPSEWVGDVREALGKLQTLLGPFPYRDLWITVVPAQSDGVEFPTSFQVADENSHGLLSLLAHEMAHQWFYSLVGNNQARDPWLDEAFATYAQAIVAHEQNSYRFSDVARRLRGKAGRPMTYWAQHGGFSHYVEGVYNEGAAALLAARRRVGNDRFDAAVRAYITTNAHRVATPADVMRAFRDLPAALDELHRAGT